MTLQRNSIVCSLLRVALRELASFSSAMRSRTPGRFIQLAALPSACLPEYSVAWRYASAPVNPLATHWANLSCRTFLREAMSVKMT